MRIWTKQWLHISKHTGYKPLHLLELFKCISVLNTSFCTTIIHLSIWHWKIGLVLLYILFLYYDSTVPFGGGGMSKMCCEHQKLWSPDIILCHNKTVSWREKWQYEKVWIMTKKLRLGIHKYTKNYAVPIPCHFSPQIQINWSPNHNTVLCFWVEGDNYINCNLIIHSEVTINNWGVIKEKATMCLK